MKRISWLFFASAVVALAIHRLVVRRLGSKLDPVQAMAYDLKPVHKGFRTSALVTAANLLRISAVLLIAIGIAAFVAGD